MSQRRAIAAAALMAALAGIKPVAAERLVTSISRHQVMVNSSFAGTSIVLFGTIEPDTPASRRRATGYDVVVTVIGPKQTMVERRKERVLGIWTNVGSRTFLNAPSYLAVLSNQPFDQITNPETVRQLQLGLSDKLFPQQLGGDIGDVAREDPFRANFLRLKMQHQLYIQKTNGVTLLTPTVFRAEISVPAEAPIGNYDVDVKAFADGTLLTRATSAFEIVKVGFEQFVANTAQEYGLLYGLSTAMMAVMTGWFAAVVFRRD